MNEPLLELDVGAVAAGGGCIAHAPDGRVVFVRHCLPGERVRARLTSTTNSFHRADAVEVLRASPDRVDAPCPFAGPGRCGGCDFQHVTPERQRELKAELVAEQLRRVARLDRQIVVEAVALDEAPDDGLGWRTRVRFGVDASGRLGLHRHRSHALVLVDRCLLATREVAAAGVEQLVWPGASAVEIAADRTQTVVSATGRLRGAPDVAGGLVVDGRGVRAPHGLRPEVLGRRFEVSAGSFWQVHRAAATVLAMGVLELLDPQPGDVVVDLYAGVGLFAALLGERVGADGAVLAVESDARACADAARNTADLPQVRVRTAEVDAAQLRRIGAPDLVVLDPPRAGLGVASSRALAALRPRAVAYVSCDPATFARDLRVLFDAGWELGSLRALDLYPMTEHVELLAGLRPPA